MPSINPIAQETIFNTFSYQIEKLGQSVGAVLGSTGLFLFKNPGFPTNGVLGIIGGAQAIKATIDLTNCIKIKDFEGQKIASAELTYSALSVNTAAFSIANLALASAVSAVAITSSLSNGLSSILSLAISIVGLFQCLKFQNTIQTLQKPEEGLDRKNLLIRTLEFLQKQIRPTEIEKNELYESICTRYPNLSQEQQHKLWMKELSDLTQKKINFVIRRAGKNSATIIEEHVDKLLNHLKNDVDPENACTNAANLIKTVNIGIRKEKLLFGLFAMLAIAGFFALIIGTVFSCGILPVIIYSASGTITLSILIYMEIIRRVHNSTPSITATEMLFQTT